MEAGSGSGVCPRRLSAQTWKRGLSPSSVPVVSPLSPVISKRGLSPLSPNGVCPRYPPRRTGRTSLGGRLRRPVPAPSRRPALAPLSGDRPRGSRLGCPLCGNSRARQLKDGSGVWKRGLSPSSVRTNGVRTNGVCPRYLPNGVCPRYLQTGSVPVIFTDRPVYLCRISNCARRSLYSSKTTS